MLSSVANRFRAHEQGILNRDASRPFTGGRELPSLRSDYWQASP